jgi:hypothetical protein
MRNPVNVNPVNVLVGLTLVLAVCTAQPTQAAGIFTAASIKGSYVYANNTEGVASFGPMSFNGRGRVTLAIKANLPCAKPGPSCKRTIVDVTGVGTYTVASDGTGAATFTLKVGGKVLGKEKYDFVITGATAEGAILLATQLFAADETGGLGGQLVAPTWSRVSD